MSTAEYEDVSMMEADLAMTAATSARTEMETVSYTHLTLPTSDLV